MANLLGKTVKRPGDPDHTADVLRVVKNGCGY